jgi:hypothetical protein
VFQTATGATGPTLDHRGAYFVEALIAALPGSSSVWTHGRCLVFAIASDGVLSTLFSSAFNLPPGGDFGDSFTGILDLTNARDSPPFTLQAQCLSDTSSNYFNPSNVVWYVSAVQTTSG